ncbi:hypothetical protein FRB96_005428 [Tulasnella sp. 330]|nr:hypothetical protein FRB96_005428 [Tulasnella sp. 330]
MVYRYPIANLEEHLDKMESLQDRFLIAGGIMTDTEYMEIVLGSLPPAFDAIKGMVSIFDEGTIYTATWVCKHLVDADRRMRAAAALVPDTYATHAFQRQPATKASLTCNYCHNPSHWKVADVEATEEERMMAMFKKFMALEKVGQPDPSASFISTHTVDVLNSSSIVVDGAATRHMSPDVALFSNYHEHNPPLKIHLAGQDKWIPAVGEGTLTVHGVLPDASTVKLIFPHVLHAPDLHGTLISESELTDMADIKVLAKGKTKVIRNCMDGRTVVVANKLHGLYHIDVAPVTASQNTSFVFAYLACSLSTSLKSLHEHLGHLHLQGICTLLNKGLITGVRCDDLNKDFTWFTPTYGVRLTQSVHGAHYFISFTDDHSNITDIYFLHLKSDAFNAFQQWQKAVEMETRCQPRAFRADGGGEFEQIWKWCIENGVHFQASAPYSQQMNGVAERGMRTYVEIACCALLASGLPKKYWSYVVAYAAYTCAYCPTQMLDGKVPIEAWTGVKPDATHLHPFGCDAFVHILPDKGRDKLEAKAIKCAFLGYVRGSSRDKGSPLFRLVDRRTGKLYKSRDVTFIDSQFTADLSQIPDPLTMMIKQYWTLTHLHAAHVSIDRYHPLVNSHFIKTADCLNAFGFLVKGEDPLSLEVDIFAYRAVDGDSPLTLKEVLACPDAEKWQAAMEKEMSSLYGTGTLIPTSLPPGRRPITCKWVFKIKRDQDGNINKYKAWLVARGFTQIEGIDFQDTYTPVVKFATLRTFFAVCAQWDLDVYQMDVTAAFLNGRLDEEIYMTAPPGVAGADKIFHLGRPLYGLKQGSRNWYREVDEALREMGFTQTQADHSLWTFRCGDLVVIIPVYVDDLLFGTNNSAEFLKIKAELECRFEMTGGNEANWCLGIRIMQDRSKETITLSQRKYIEDILVDFGMSDCRPVSTPLPPNVQYS